MQSKSAAILEEASKAHPENATITEYLGEALSRLATYDRLNGDHVAALETYRRSHHIFGDLLRADPKNSLAKSNFGFSNSGIGWSLLALGKTASGAKIFRESIASFEEMSPRTASMRYPRSGLADAYSGLGEAYLILAASTGTPSSQKRVYWQESLTSCQKSLTLWNDKEKRAELEKDEEDGPSHAAHCVATSEEHLRSLLAERNDPK